MRIPVGQQLLRWIGHQGGPRGRDRILRAFSDPDNHKPYPFEVDFFGQVYSGNLANFIDWTVFYYGAFGLHELRLLSAIGDALRAQGKQVNFFDVGANIGHHTLAMARHADRIFSFEPYAIVRNEMIRKLSHANVHNATIFPVALGDRDEFHSFHPPTGSNQGTGTLGDLLPDNASAESISVQVVRGDTFFAENRLPPISLLKIDVEGYELKVLEGLRETIWRDRPPILTEIQREHTLDPLKGNSVRDLLYPDHRIFEVDTSRGQYVLKPFSLENTGEALVLPAELAGIVQGSRV